MNLPHNWFGSASKSPAVFSFFDGILSRHLRLDLRWWSVPPQAEQWRILILFGKIKLWRFPQTQMLRSCMLTNGVQKAAYNKLTPILSNLSTPAWNEGRRLLPIEIPRWNIWAPQTAILLKEQEIGITMSHTDNSRSNWTKPFSNSSWTIPR